MTVPNPAPLVIHGWTVFALPLFIAQLNTLAEQVSSIKQKDPIGLEKKNSTKCLAVLTKLAFNIIPQDPTLPEYRQGKALGEAHKHCFLRSSFNNTDCFFATTHRAK